MPNQDDNTTAQNDGLSTPPPDYPNAVSRGLLPTPSFVQVYEAAAADEVTVNDETEEARQLRAALQASIDDRHGAAVPQAGTAPPSYAQHLNAAGYHPDSFAARSQLQQGAASAAAAAAAGQQPPVYSYAAPPSNTTGPYPTVYAYVVPAGTQNAPTPRLRRRQGQTFDRSGQRPQQPEGNGSSRRGRR